MLLSTGQKSCHIILIQINGTFSLPVFFIDPIKGTIITLHSITPHFLFSNSYFRIIIPIHTLEINVAFISFCVIMKNRAFFHWTK